MMKKLIFVAGAGVGYVLGTRAGRTRYEAMKAKARHVLDRPDVREATDAIQAEANRLYDEGRQLVRDRVKTLRDRNGSSTSLDDESYAPATSTPSPTASRQPITPTPTPISPARPPNSTHP